MKPLVKTGWGHIFVVVILLVLVEINSRLYAEPPEKTKTWEEVIKGICSGNQKEQLLSLFGMPHPLYEAPQAVILKIVPCLVELAKTQQNTNPPRAGLVIGLLEDLRSKGSNALPFLDKLAADTNANENLRVSSFTAIMRIAPDSESFNRVMLIALHDASDSLHKSALAHLHSFPHDQIPSKTKFIPDLIASVEAKRLPNQSEAIAALGYIGRNSPEAISAIRKQLDSNKAVNRGAAIIALSTAEALTQDDILKIGKLLSDKDESVRENAVAILNLVGEKAQSVTNELEHAATGTDPRVASVAKQILDRLRSDFEEKKSKKLQQRH